MGRVPSATATAGKSKSSPWVSRFMASLWRDGRIGANELGYLCHVPLVSLDRVSIAFGRLPLLDEVQLQVDPRERVSVIGRNGTGKSTLLKILSGEIPPDSGTVWRQPALKVARLEQDVPLSAHRSVFDIVAEGHTHHLEEDDEWLREQHVDIEAITWLETFLGEYAGAVIFVTHDRAFLRRLATRIIELDRGQLTSWP